MKINDEFLIKVLDFLISNNARPILVGGCVRDSFLDISVKDYDIEVYGLSSLERLEEILQPFGSVNLVGKSFGILKLVTPDMEYDISFPRLENKTTQGHRGFEVQINGNLRYEEAAKRRDFTINSIGYDYKNKCYLDPFNGKKDLSNKLLRHINDDTFIEDPLRVYRAIQLSARFNLHLDKKTFKLCKMIVQTEEFKSLSNERILEEYKKLFLKAKKPSLGLNLINSLEIDTILQKDIENVDILVAKEEDEMLFLVYTILFDYMKNIIYNKKLLRKISTFMDFQIHSSLRKNMNNNDGIVNQLIMKLKVQKSMPKPLFSGKDLIKMGFTPSEKFKLILDTLYKMQLSGKIC